MSDNRKFSGLFGRKATGRAVSSKSRRSSLDVPDPENSRASISHRSIADDTNPSITFDDPAKPQRSSESIDARSFFRFARRKKATSISRSDDGMRSSIDRANSIDHGRPSLQSIRNPLDALFRPSFSARSSTTSIQVIPESGTSFGPPKVSLNGVELPNPSDTLSRDRRSSLRSVNSGRSTAISDRTPTAKSTTDSMHKIKGRGRSSTYAGEAAQRTASGASKPNKFFSLGRLRRDQDDNLLFRVISRDRSPHPRLAPASPGRADKESIQNLPQTIEGESAYQFLARLEVKVPRMAIASLLATSDDRLHHECLQLYMQSFDLVDDPLDMALRKLLMNTRLPKETQQIDRLLNAFAERYQICNPRLFDSQATPYVLSFALIMLHTDKFNQNNKNKMTKAQFLKNTTSEHTSRVSSDVLEYFYDNIVSTPFILVEDDTDLSEFEQSGPSTPVETPTSAVSRNSTIAAMSQTSNYFGKRGMDLYPLIMENKLESLRPQLGPLLNVDDIMSYTGTLPILNVSKLHHAFAHPARLQLVSARSRPEAFVTDDSTLNPLATDPGLVDIQITKIGILRKREQRKPNAKPVYREWGVMLTPSQLLLFKNVAWIKPYLQQSRERSRDKDIILTPPVHNYSPDTYMPTSDTVAVFDAAVSKKPTHFSFYGRSGQQTHLIAPSEDDMNDWIAKINYAAAFHTVGVRIRGTVQDDQMSIRRVHRHTSMSSTSTIATHVESTQEIAIARQTILKGKITGLAKLVREKEDSVSLLQQYARNLCTLAPVQARTRSQLISAAGSLSAKISWARMELCKAQCHHDILAKDLQLELQPDCNAYTAPVRPRTPNSEHSTNLKTSPSRSKLGTVFRQVSTDTMKRVNRQFSSSSDPKRIVSPVPSLPAGNGHNKTASEFSLPNIDLSAESLSHLFTNSPDRNHTTGASLHSRITSESINAPARRASPVPALDAERPRTASSLKLSLSKLKQQRAGSAADGDEEVLTSASSRESDGRFILHGRKVSVVQTPVNLTNEHTPHVNTDEKNDE